MLITTQHKTNINWVYPNKKREAKGAEAAAEAAAAAAAEAERKPEEWRAGEDEVKVGFFLHRSTIIAIPAIVLQTKQHPYNMNPKKT